MSLNNIYAQFESFVAKLFEREGYAVSREVSVGGHSKVDLLIKSDSTRAVVEVKLYRSRSISPTILRSAAAQVLFYQSQMDVGTKAILVTNIAVDPLTRRQMEAVYNIAIYDFNILSTLSAKYPDLQEEFEAITREADTFQPGPLPVASETEPISVERIPVSSGATRVAARPTNRGQQICATLKALTSGRTDAAKFEAACVDALRYVFQDDFAGWTTQPTTNSGLHRFDLIARISSEESFWNSLIQDFRTRYVVFEFKNYAEEISQGAIYSTEKYLFPAAMRATAIIISRMGAHPHAHEAARGALRESGKLILNLSIKDLCEMLKLKDSGDSPTDVLAILLDEMLIHIDR